MKLKLIIGLVVLLVAGGAVYKLKFSKEEPKPKVEGAVYVLPKDFTVNLDEGRFAKLGTAIVVPHEYKPEAAGEEGATPPEGYGADPQEALVRGIVTDTLTGVKADDLIEAKGRHELTEQIKKKIDKSTDIPAEEVVFTDISVQ